MKQPVICSSASQDCEPGGFNFTSRLDFEARSNLLRSRSDTCLRKYGRQADSPLKSKAVIDPWTIPSIDFSFNGYKPKTSWLEAKKNQHEKRRKNKVYVRIPLPRMLEKPVAKETPFITTFRSSSARTARIIGVKEGMHPVGPYKTWGPHTFRGDDFRPDSGIRNKRKPPFLTSYARDPGNLELQRKTISAHIGFGCLDGDGLEKMIQEEESKPFLTSAKQQPKWDQNLMLKKERYQRGMSEEEIRMNRIMKQLSWYSGREMRERRMDRPDIKDYKTVDWLQVTQHCKDETTILH